MSLGIASDELVYVFVDGKPVGDGIPQGQSGDVFGYVDENNTIVLTGNLEDGTYTIKYEMEDGSTVDIGDLVLTEEPIEAVYTNIFDPSTATINARASISSGYAEVDGAVVTDFIDIRDKVPFTENVKIYVKNANFDKLSAGNDYPRLLFYTTKPSSGFSNPYSAVYTSIITQIDEGNGVVSAAVSKGNAPENVKYMVVVLKVKDTAITMEDIQDIVVTINEPIYL